MKKKTLFLIMVISLLFVMGSVVLGANIVGLQWNTFQGSVNDDQSCDALVRSSSGKIYVAGDSWGPWGTPVSGHSGNYDCYVACLDASGNLLWHTFLGSDTQDVHPGIAVDSSDNVYVAGGSLATWGSPLNAHSGGGHDLFIAKLDSSGNVIWNTFLGGANNDSSYDIILSGSNLYVTGNSNASWGTPVNAYSGAGDVVVACLNTSGTLIWNTFLGSSGENQYAKTIALDSSGNVYVGGNSMGSWGTPINAFSGNIDAFAAKLDSSGNQLWNTFFGQVTGDLGEDIALDASGNVYLSGSSNAAWGSPVNPFSGQRDAFVVAMDSSGNLTWHTFLGSQFGEEEGQAIAITGSGNIMVAGHGNSTWGTPANPYNDDRDVFVAELNSTGNLVWNTFMGSADDDYSGEITLDGSGNVFVAGNSRSNWGSPVNAHSGGSSLDVFVAVISTNPWTDIVANDSDGPISINESDTLQLRVTLNGFGSSDNVDYWLAYKGPSGWVHYNNSTKKWEAGLGVTHQGPLMALYNKKVFQAKLSPGSYTFYFGVDMNMDGKITKSSLYKDEVQVTVNASSN